MSKRVLCKESFVGDGEAVPEAKSQLLDRCRKKLATGSVRIKAEEHVADERLQFKAVKSELKQEPEDTLKNRPPAVVNTEGSDQRKSSITTTARSRAKVCLRRKPSSVCTDGRFRVAGVSFEGRQAHIPLLVRNQTIMLLPEPGNPYDSRAVGVYTLDGTKLGFIPREHNWRHDFRAPLSANIGSTGFANNTNLMGIYLAVPGDHEQQPRLLPMPLPDTQQAKDAVSQLEQRMQRFKAAILVKALMKQRKGKLAWDLEAYQRKEWAAVWVVDGDTKRVLLSRVELVEPPVKKALTLFHKTQDYKQMLEAAVAFKQYQPAFMPLTNSVVSQTEADLHLSAFLTWGLNKKTTMTAVGWPVIVPDQIPVHEASLMQFPGLSNSMKKHGFSIVPDVQVQSGAQA